MVRGTSDGEPRYYALQVDPGDQQFGPWRLKISELEPGSTIGRTGALIGTDGLRPLRLLRKSAGHGADGLYLTKGDLPPGWLRANSRRNSRPGRASAAVGMR